MDETQFDAENIGALIRSKTEVMFSNLVRGSEEIKFFLNRVTSAGRNIPKARGTAQIRSIDRWFDSYKRQIVWNIEAFNTTVEAHHSGATGTAKSLVEALNPTIEDIYTELGLVEFTPPDYASSRVNVSRPLESFQRYEKNLKARLRIIASEALNKSVHDTYDLLFKGAAAEKALNDNLGSVAFRQEGDLVEIAPGQEGERVDLRELVADALEDMLEEELLQSAEQRNRSIVNLIKSYALRFRGNSPDSDLILYSLGVKIFSAMPSLEHPDYVDERVPEKFLSGLRTLLVHHESYIWSIPRIREIIEFRRKTLESYSATAVSQVVIQRMILAEMSKAEYLFGSRTRDTITELNDASDAPAQIGVGREAIQYGLLRGGLQFIGRVIVQMRKSAIQIGRSTMQNVLSQATTTAVIASPLYPPIERFVSSHLDTLTQLASSTSDWGWLHYVLQIFGVN